MSDFDALSLTQELIRRQSITPDDQGCQELLAQILGDAGFKIDKQRYGEVDNLFAWHGNDSKDSQSLLFVGHTDVVATGDENLWKHPPFAAIIDGEYLYGRGAADMKCAVAAFTLAVIDFVQANPNHLGKIAILITSDEEGEAIDGIKKMMPHIAKNHKFDFCVVGEPSSSEVLGDVVRIGRRGSLHAEIIIHGKQGHVAYPENALNPVFLAAPFIAELSNYQWDQGNNDFPPTSFQISSVTTSTNTSNIIPADMILQTNFRFSPESDKKSLEKQLQQILSNYKLEYSINWNLSGLPFHCTNSLLKEAIKNSIIANSNTETEFNTGGGTSDGRFIAPFGVEVVELGVVNKTIHQIDECVLVNDVTYLHDIYLQVTKDLMT